MESLFFHPKLVHLPMALGVLMPLVAGGVLLAWWRKWLPARAWAIVIALQVILVGSGIAALRSGEAEEDRVERVVPERLIKAHEEAAEGFVWASGGVLGLMALAMAFASRRPGLPIAVVSTLGAFVVLGLGYRAGQAGGSLVYEHGAAGAYTREGSSPALVEEAAHDHHAR